MHQENLSGERKSNARTCCFCGEEWDEDFTSYIIGYGASVVADEQSSVPADANGGGTCFYGILYQIYKHLTEKIAVRLEHEIG